MNEVHQQNYFEAQSYKWHMILITGTYLVLEFCVHFDMKYALENVSIYISKEA